MSEKSTIFKQHLLKKNHMNFFKIFTIESSHCTLQADKSFEPLNEKKNKFFLRGGGVWGGGGSGCGGVSGWM